MKFPSSSLGGISAIFVDTFILTSMFLILMLANIVLHLPETTALTTAGSSPSDQPPSTKPPLITITVTPDGIRLDRSPDLLTAEDLDRALTPFAKREGIPLICAIGIPFEAVWVLKARVEAALGREASFLVCKGET